MEKLVYIAYREAGSDSESFAEELRGPVAARLRSLRAQKLKICVRDEAVARGETLMMTPDGSRPKDGMVSFWLEQSQERAECEQVLRQIPGLEKLDGFLVVESEPLVNREHRSAPAERTPGFSLVTAIVPKAGLSHDEFVERWYRDQRDMAIETQSTFQYIRNEIVRPLTADPPAWAAIVEEGFPLGALDDPHVFYDAQGSDERFQANAKRMFDTVQTFLDLAQVSSHPMSEYVFER